MQSYTSIILIVVMIIAFYFLIIRPQRKRSQQQQEMVRKLEPGARVVTTTGIYATIIALGDKQVVLETSPGAQIIMLKQAVGRVVGDEEEDSALSSYRGSGTPAAQQPADPGAAAAAGAAGQGYTGEQQGDTGEPADNSTSGMAGGAPIQEYTPGSQPEAGPDFSSPTDDQSQHQTAPWPPQGNSDPSGSYSSPGSSLGDSSLNAYDEQVRSRGDADAGDQPEAPRSDDQKQA